VVHGIGKCKKSTAPKSSMKIDQNRLKRQQQVIQRWTKCGRRGTLEAVTGFGKTYVALLILKDLHEQKPDGTALVIVPTTNLKKQWSDKCEEMGLTNVTVLVINTAVKRSHTCDLLVLDEIHNYTSEVFGKIFEQATYKYILGLTATLDREDMRHYLIEKVAPVIDTVTLKEAVENAYVSKFLVLNLGLRMSDQEEKEYKEIVDQYYKHFALFNNRFNIAMSCMQNASYRYTYTKTLSGWNETEVLNKARAWHRAMQSRMRFIYNSTTKQDAAKALIEMYDVPTITFSQSVNFAVSLDKQTQPWSKAYHSKITKYKRQAILEDFADPRTDTRIIHTARALDEGFDVNGIELAIVCSGSSTPRQDLQRTGRAIRFQPDKLGVIVNLYLRDTQDEKWLKKRQTKTTGVQYVHSLQEISGLVGNALLRNPSAYHV